MEAAARVENEFHKFILGLGKSGQLSMAQITKGSQYTFDLYFFCYCSWGSRPALSSWVMKQPLEMPGRPTLAAA
jgi:hypothetical protein